MLYYAMPYYACYAVLCFALLHNAVLCYTSRCSGTVPGDSNAEELSILAQKLQETTRGEFRV